jgi:hypothetical protein
MLYLNASKEGGLEANTEKENVSPCLITRMQDRIKTYRQLISPSNIWEQQQ